MSTRRNPVIGVSSSGAVGFSAVMASTARRRGNELGCVKERGQQDTAPKSATTVMDADVEVGSNGRSAGTKGGCRIPHSMHDSTAAPESRTFATTATEIANDTRSSVVTFAKARTRHSGKKEVRTEEDPGSLRPVSRACLTRTRSVRRIWKDGPGNNADSEEVCRGKRSRCYVERTIITHILCMRRAASNAKTIT